MKYVLKAESLRKEYGEHIAVKGLSLQVEQGEVFGFLGPNGAGKTTSIKMLIGLVRPTSGGGELLEKPIGDINALAKIGFLPEHFRFHELLTANEFLKFHSELLGMNYAEFISRSNYLLGRVGLTLFRDKQLKTFSKGMLQRIGLAQTLLNHPSIVFLDEPTSGLDPAGRLLVRDIIKELREEGVTVFLNSHLLSEIELICNRVAFISHGEVIQTLDISSLASSQTILKIRTKGIFSDVLIGLEQWGQNIKVDGNILTMNLNGEEFLPKINQYLAEQKVQVYEVMPSHKTLEEVFIEIVGKDGGL